ncbi:MAG TPA: hypothetical protein VF810_02990 [Patescibacteria group bacterium]
MFNQFQYNITTLFKERKQDALILIFALILIIIIISIGIIFFTSKQSSLQTPNSPQITQTPSPSPSAPPFLNSDAAGHLGEKVANKQPLSDQDQTAKTNMLNNILGGANSGVVYETANVQVQYVQEADVFTAEILTTNISQAKADAQTWFTEQGFSDTGICNLPIMFFLGPEASILRDKPINFSPLPDGC